MTDEQYRENKQHILIDPRYTIALRLWMLEQLRKMYVERNGKEPPDD